MELHLTNLVTEDFPGEMVVNVFGMRARGATHRCRYPRHQRDVVLQDWSEVEAELSASIALVWMVNNS